MKRDMELVRAILFALEDLPEGEDPPENLVIEGYSEKAISYHLYQMGKAGLLRVLDVGASQDPDAVLVLGITWAGHDFADAARSGPVWDAAKGALAKAGGAGLDVFTALLKGFAKQKLKEVTGFDLGD